MKYKSLNIIYFLAAALLASCVYYTDPLFDKSASERVAESLQVYRELLTAQTNGWIVEYYPEKNQKYGGFNLYFRFEGEDVTVRSEIDPAASVTSIWSTGTDMGPTINFDTYNKLLHFFSDPSIRQGGGYGLNYEGDYEFVVDSGSAEEFILRGKKTKNTIRMTPLPADLSWEEYSLLLQNMKENVNAPAYKMTVGSSEISIAKSVGYNVFFLNTNNARFSAPFIVTPTGIKFYEPITILNETFQVFNYHAAEDNIVSDNQRAEISFVLLPLSNYFVENLPFANWYFKAENIGQGLLADWNTIKNNLEDQLNETLYMMQLGKIAEDFPVGITFASWDYEENRPWYGTYVYDFNVVSGNQVRFAYNNARTNAEGINASYYSPLLRAFTITAFNGKIFTLEPDIDVSNPKDMTKIQEITLRDVQNPDNWVKLSLEELIWP